MLHGMAGDYPVALYLQDAHDIRQGMQLVQRAEQRGFHAVWQADSRLVRDAVVPMAAFAADRADQDRLGVIDIWTRNAARLASTFDARRPRPGRIICGVGDWWTRWRRRSARLLRPLTACARGGALRGLLANETVTQQLMVNLDGVELTTSIRAPPMTCRSRSVPPTVMMSSPVSSPTAWCSTTSSTPSTTPRRWNTAWCRQGRARRRPDRPADLQRRRQPRPFLDAARLMVTQYLGQQPHP